MLIACDGAASTAFAIYSAKTLYGVNLDSEAREVRFSIETQGDGVVFFVSSEVDGVFLPTVGMNRDGLFASTQSVLPRRATSGSDSDEELPVWDAFYDGLRASSSVENVIRWIGDRRLVQEPPLELHTLYADRGGDARIVECGIGGNTISEMSGSSLVMTNFRNGDFLSLGLDDIAGHGAERYRIAHRYLEERADAFDIDEGFELLRRASMSTGDRPTRCSLVFDPKELEVYVALERDYERVWKVSLIERTIETHRGFEEHRALALDEAGLPSGILSAEADGEAVDAGGPSRALGWIALIAGGILAIVLWLVLGE